MNRPVVDGSGAKEGAVGPRFGQRLGVKLAGFGLFGFLCVGGGARAADTTNSRCGGPVGADPCAARVAQLAEDGFATSGSWSLPKPASGINDIPSPGFEGPSVESGPMATLKRWFQPGLTLGTWLVGSVIASWAAVMFKRPFLEAFGWQDKSPTIDFMGGITKLNDIAVGSYQLWLVTSYSVSIENFLLTIDSLGESIEKRSEVPAGCTEAPEGRALLVYIQAYRAKVDTSGRVDCRDEIFVDNLTLLSTDLKNLRKSLFERNGGRDSNGDYSFNREYIDASPEELVELAIKRFEDNSSTWIPQDKIAEIKQALLGDFAADMKRLAMLEKLCRPLKWVGLARW